MCILMESAMPALLCIVALFLFLWKVMCVCLRAKRSRYIASLNPTLDAQLIYRITNFVEFPFLSNKALDLAFFGSFAIPSISQLLQSTGQFVPKYVKKRYDDTDILIQEFSVNHVESPRGSLAIRRLNFIHSRFKISNSDFLYTLVLFILEPSRLSAKFGFRDWTETEKQAQFIVWRDIGTRMGLQDIPESLEEMERFRKQYEEEKMAFSDSNKACGDCTLDLMLSSAPALLRPIVRRFVYALTDETLLIAMGYPVQPWWVIWTAENVLRFWYGTFVRWFLPPRPLSWSRERIPLGEGEENEEKVYKVRHDVYKPGSYPEGYRIRDMGNGKAGEVGQVGEGRLFCPLRSQKKIN